MSATQPPASAAAPAWRQYPFFDVHPVKDAHDLGSTPEIFKNVPEISTIASTSAGILVADIHGSVHLLGPDFVPKHSFVVHPTGRVTHMAESKGILVSLAQDDKIPQPLLKIWDLEHFDKKTGSPMLMRSVKLAVGIKPHPVSTIALSTSLSHLAIGFGDGSVQIYRHLDQSLFSGSTSLTNIPKPKVIHESPTEPVTGLGFRENDDLPISLLHLFIVTTGRVLCYIAAGKGSGLPPTVVDELGCGLGCAVMDSSREEMVVAREEALYMCRPEGRGSSFAYEGTKSYIYTFKTYVVIVSPPFYPKPSNASATVRNYVARAPDQTAVTQQDISKVTILDVKNNFVAYSGPFKEGVRDVMFRKDDVYVLANDGQLYCLDEKPIKDKLEILFRQSRFFLAIAVARAAGMDESGIADIHRQYGDHLYAQGADDNAMQQYVKTIGYLQPSYVIRKFLDAKRISNLTLYLQELHTRGLANADHTTLLLNTYTKLKDVARLDSFIKHRTTATDGGEPPFDLDTAIRVCRQAGYFEHAVYLAKKYHRHEDYMRIQIEDAGNYKDALEYLKEQGPEAAETNLARYGRAMLMNLPDETTQVLVELCSGTGFAAPPPPTDVVATASESPVPAQGHQRSMTIASVRRSHHDGESSSRAPSPPPTITGVRALAPTTKVRRPSPRQFFAHFVDHPPQFLVFLEAVAKNTSTDGDEQDNNGDRQAIWNTLLELYLARAGSSSSSDASASAKALQILHDDLAERAHALLVCSTYEFTEGLVALWEKMGMYEDVLRFYMDRENTSSGTGSKEVVRYLDVYGPAHPHLYMLVLRFLTSSAALLSRHQDDVGRILDVVDREGIVPPLKVVQILSRNDVASVGLVKEWLVGRIRKARGEIDADKQVIDAYRKDTSSKLQEIADLTDTNNPRVFHVTRCSACGGQLSLPAIHFMCKHSYHERCLGEHQSECPNCAAQHGVIKEIKRDNDAFGERQGLFLAHVNEGGFEAIAEGFGKGLLGPKVGGEAA